MAFRASELRLILGIQSYGTANLARLRRDLMALNRAVDVGTANQDRVQSQLAAKRAKIAAGQQRIARMENRIASGRAMLDARAAVDAERFAGRRAALAQREMALADAVAGRRLQIGRTQDRIQAMQGSGMQRFAIQEQQALQRRMNIQNQLNTLNREGIGLEAQSFRQQAARIASFRALAKAAGGAAQASKIAADPAAFKAAPSRVKELALRYNAVRKDGEKIAAAQKDITGRVAATTQSLAVAAEQEKLISARKFEQAAAIGRTQELMTLQQASLSTLAEKEELLHAEARAITAQEGLTNAARQKGLVAIEEQLAGLEAQRAVVAQLIAEEETLSTTRMQDAIAADRRAQQMQRLGRREVLGRTIAHAGRTAQFGGLIGIAGLGAAANSFANLNKSAALAGTQMRNVGGSFIQARARGELLTDTILEMMERFPTGAEEMADSAYDIFSSMNLVNNGVVNVAQGLELLETANKAAVAGQVDLEEATSAMIITLNNFDPELKNVDMIMNQVFATVRFGQMRLSDFAAAMVPLAPVAKTTGLSLLDVGSALATLTILFKSPQQAAQGLARAIELLQLQPFKEGLHAAGVEVEDTSKRMRPLFMIVKDLAKQFPEAATGQRSMVDLLTRLSKASGMTKAGIQGTVQARRALAGLVTSMVLYDNILKNIEGSQNEFNQAFDAMKDTPGVQWAIFLNQMKAFVLTIGQEALPVMLRFGQWLIDAAHWIEDLIKRTDGAAVRWAAWAAGIALVGGTLLNLVGSMVAFAANLRIATISMAGLEAGATRAGMAMGLLRGAMMGLMGLGIIAIPIVIQLIKGGDPGLWDYLFGAAAGATGGAMIGGAIGTIFGGPGIGTAVGAAAGAITVPIILNIIAKFQEGDQPATGLSAAWGKYLKMVNDDAKKANEQFFGKGAKDPWQVRSFEEFSKMWQKNIKDAAKVAIPRTGEDVGKATQAQLAKPKTLYEEYLQWFKGFTKEQIEAQNAWFDQMAEGEDTADTAARLAKARAKAIAQAHENMEQKIEQAIDKLAGVYDKFLDMNKQAFGEVFQGPFMTGIVGSIFTDINDMLMQFGQTIPVPIQLINQDLEIQMKNFSKLREGYAELLRRGVPLEVVQQIQQMGMAGLPFIQGLLQKAGGPEFKKWLANMKKGHEDIVKATEIDFDAQLAQWEKYGSDIATKIIDGLSSEAAQAVLKGGFRDHVIRLFGDTFKKEMAAEIAKALKEIAEEEAARVAAEKRAKAAAKAAKDAAIKGGPPLGGKTPTMIDPRTGRAVTTATTAADRAGGRTGITHGPPMPATFAGYTATLPSAAFTGARTVVNNNGDTYTIHADGVHPANVTKAMNKNAFGKRHKRRN